MSEVEKITGTKMKVLRFIALNLDEAYASNIAEKLDKDGSTISTHISDLKEKGLVQVVSGDSNTQFLEPTMKGYKFFIRSIKSNEDIPQIGLRHHSIRVKFQIKSGFEELTDEEKSGNQIALNNWTKTQDEIDTRLHYVETVSYCVTTNAVIINVPEIYAPPTIDGVARCTADAIGAGTVVKNELEERNDSLEFRDAPIAEIPYQHWAFEKHPIAVAMDQLDCTGTIADLDGAKLTVDKSRGFGEAEVEGGKKSELYARNLASSLKYQALNPLDKKIQELEDRNKQLEEKVSNLQNQLGNIQADTEGLGY